MENVRPLDVAMLCPAGFENVVARAASHELPRFVESERSSGFIRGQTIASARQLRTFPCATNVFAVIDAVRRTVPDHEVREFTMRLKTTSRPTGLPAHGTLRLRIHDDGRFGSTSTQAATSLEDALSSWSQLRVSRRSGSLEIWLVRRSDQRDTILASKLTRGQRILDRGVLRPEICAALARIEPVTGAELVLDPFAGSGAIGEACMEAGARSVWLNDREAPGSCRSRTLTSSAIRWTHQDFRDLQVTPETVTTVVTDPPWGHYTAGDENLDRLYFDLGAAAERWLRPGGALVVLTGAPERTVDRLLNDGGLQGELSLPVLVNGRKARVILARKPRRR